MPRTAEANQQILDKRREEILKTALKVFATRGFTATKISDIAKEASVSHGLVYHYFKTKDEIFTELFKMATVLRDVSEYVINDDISPLEKIKKFIESILTFAFEGDSFYYWHIANQGYTTKSVPDEVKELIKKDRANVSNLLIPLIMEGQKLGQILPGDPLMLDSAIRATLSGLSIQMMRAKHNPGYPFTMANVDVILRLIAEPGSYETIASHKKYTRRFGQVHFIHKKMTYRVRGIGDEDFILVHMIITEIRERDIEIYRIEFERETGEKCIVRVQADNSRPLSVELSSSKTNTVALTEFRDSSVFFDIPERNIHKEIKLEGEFYTGYMLSFDFQGYPFENSEVIRYTQVLDGSEGSPLGPFGMEVKNIGRETVIVPAGQFECYKLEVKPGGVDEKLGGTYTFYYWFTVDEPHVWIKSEDLRGNLRELVKFE